MLEVSNNFFGYAAIDIAVLYGSHQALAALLRYQPQLDVPVGPRAYTPLMNAIRERDLPMVKALLQAGSDARFTNKV